MYEGKKHFDFEQPLTRLIWIASILCITTSFGMSFTLLSDLSMVGAAARRHLVLDHAAEPVVAGRPRSSVRGTLAAALIPELTKVFTSSHSKHVHEIVTASREGAPSLTILSGLVAGNFMAFWMGLLITGLMAGAYFGDLLSLNDLMMGGADEESARSSASAPSSRSVWSPSASCAWVRSTSPWTATAL